MNMGSGSTLTARPATSPVPAAHPADLGSPHDVAHSLVTPPHVSSPRPPDADRMIFRVDLDVFRGPLDLLLYLVRKHELDITRIPLASVVDQYLEHLAVLEQLDVNVVGDFLEVASMMIEIKSKLLLPRTDEEEDETPWEDPREQLVEQLLQYKQYRDAASVLEERGRNWSQCFTRLASDLPGRELDPAEQPIREVELWDLVSAMGRVLRANELNRPANIIYDDTPIQVHMENIHRRLMEDGQVAFSDMFQAGMHKSAMIGVFLAVLELVRHHCVQAEQDAMHGEIYLKPGERFTADLDLPEPDDYQSASKPR